MASGTEGGPRRHRLVDRSSLASLRPRTASFLFTAIMSKRSGSNFFPTKARMLRCSG